MLGNRSSDNHTKPLLGTGDNINNYNLGEEERRWCRKWKEVLDVEEAKNQVLFSLPMIVANVSYYAIPLVSVMFAGHLGDLELAGATLANSWACVTGFDFTKTNRTWEGLSFESFSVFLTNLKVALSSAAMVWVKILQIDNLEQRGSDPIEFNTIS
ncbi:hypothetical protein CISIN_1g037145mg [Citrus sinensis]|uniref:MATE efflux family protein n=1 Tax=Citrus sinensis TaxID=2711 RepID=A0A067F561_CITSI|nr:hypothetical protein CISIN_1g037145mg [Citrus sinensis]